MSVDTFECVPSFEPEPLRLKNTGPYKTAEYSGGCRLFRMAVESFGVELSSQDIKDGEVLLRASFIIDHLVDERKQELGPMIGRVLNGSPVEGVSDEAVQECKDYIDRQSDERQAAIISGLYTLADLPAEYEKTDDAADLAALRLQEADIYADFLKLNIDEEAHDARARLGFNRWVEIFSRSGYIVDSLFDLRDDYNSESMNVIPTLSARAVLAKVAVRELIPGFRATPARAIGRTARVAFEYIVADRFVQLTRSDNSPQTTESV